LLRRAHAILDEWLVDAFLMITRANKTIVQMVATIWTVEQDAEKTLATLER
jgi:hypothetical protein